MTDGTLSVRRRDPKPSEAAAQDAKQTAISGGSYEYFADMETVFKTGNVKAKGTDLPPVVGPADEFRVETRRTARLREFDRYLKAFKYSAALDAGLKRVGFPFRFVSASGSCLSGCPARDNIRSDPRACPARCPPDSAFWAGRRHSRAHPRIPRPTYHGYALRRDGIRGGRGDHRYVVREMSRRDLADARSECRYVHTGSWPVDADRRDDRKVAESDRTGIGFSEGAHEIAGGTRHDVGSGKSCELARGEP